MLLPLLAPRLGPFISVRPIAREIRSLEPEETTGLTFCTAYAGLSLYGERIFRRLDDVSELRDALGRGRAVTMYERHLTPLQQELAPWTAGVSRFPFERGAFVLVRGRAAQAEKAGLAGTAASPAAAAAPAGAGVASDR